MEAAHDTLIHPPIRVACSQTPKSVFAQVIASIPFPTSVSSTKPHHREVHARLSPIVASSCFSAQEHQVALCPSVSSPTFVHGRQIRLACECSHSQRFWCPTFGSGELSRTQMEIGRSERHGGARRWRMSSKLSRRKSPDNGELTNPACLPEMSPAPTFYSSATARTASWSFYNLLAATHLDSGLTDIFR